MSTPFPIWTIERPAEEILEQMGSKAKFWLEWQGPSRSDWWLFKFSRENTGEHWSEKIAAEIAGLLHISHAQVELARCDGRDGCLLRSFVHRPPASLIHGNEVLAGMVTGYDAGCTFSHRQHTFELVLQALQGIFLAREVPHAIEQMASYLVLDALVVNTDRHHENWGVLHSHHPGTAFFRIAPSYDHASSLGRELLEDRRAAILRERRVEGYVRKGRGAIFLPGEQRGASPLALVEHHARLHPQYFAPVLTSLASISDEVLTAPVDLVPDEVMPPSAKLLARKILCYTAGVLRS
ncbi:MAG: hypothetical protein JWO08_1698, partial [Verrucomicrobiaceae bacterium]|nr:hypothetical protein [Verrucomicrobiaceae bacterium]